MELAAACRRIMAAQNIERLTPAVVEAASSWMAPARLAAEGGMIMTEKTPAQLRIALFGKIQAQGEKN